MRISMLRIIITTIILMVLILIATVLFYLELAPLNSYNGIKNSVSADSVYCQTYDTLYSQPELSALVKEKAFKSALLKLSEQDSIQFVLNLKDSSASLYMKGVRIHSTKLLIFNIDPVMSNLPMREYLYFFSQPVPIVSQNASIVKEPIVVRQAPKDTAEAAQQAYQPDTLIQDPAFLELTLQGGFSMIFEQSENLNKIDQKAREEFLNAIKKRQLKQNISLIRERKPTQHAPVITVELPAEDLRAIYRALPVNALVVVYY